MKRLKFLVVSMFMLTASMVPANSGVAAPLSVMPHVTTEMLDASYWIEKLNDPDQVIMNSREIEIFNAEIMRKLPTTVYDLTSYPDSLSKQDLTKLLLKYSFPTSTLFTNGRAIEAAYYDNLKSLMNFEGVQETNSVQFGFTVKRADIRTFPTDDAVLESADDIEFDQFQETAVGPAEALLVLHTSKDGKWFFVQNHDYLGWMKADSIAVGSKDEWLNYQKSNQFLVVTGNMLQLGFNEYSPELSELAFGMGAKLPLAVGDEIPRLVDNQSVAGNYVVKIPVKNQAGQLDFKLALVSAASDVYEGYLPYTRASILKQAFKMQGQRYGWGGSFHSRDCSAFIQDIYAVFGFQLPRNADEQENSAGITVNIPEQATRLERAALLSKMKPGATLHMNGHVMLYLGEENGHEYIVHDIAAQGDSNHPLPEGKLKRVPINQVAVTDVELLRSNGKQLLESLRTLKQIEK